MRLIDADTLKEDIDNLRLFKKWIREEIKQHIDNAPTVKPYCYFCGQKEHGQTVEKPQGEWVGNDFDEHHCNRCGHPALWEEEPDNYYEVQSNFCPNCGADMRGKEE